MATVFISYSSKDSDFAQLVESKLEDEAKVSAWIDNSGIHSGDEWQEEIDKALDSCYVVLLILSPNSLNARYVTYELGYALGQKKLVIPLLRQDTERHPRVARIQHRDFTGDPERRPWLELYEKIDGHRPQPTSTQTRNLVPQVFISYDRGDFDFAELAKMQLEKRGVKQVSVEFSGVRARSNWATEIDTALDKAQVVLVVLSPNSLYSRYVTYEFGYALGQGKRVIPLLRQKIEGKRHPRLESLPDYDFRNPKVRPWAELAAELKEALSSGTEALSNGMKKQESNKELWRGFSRNIRAHALEEVPRPRRCSIGSSSSCSSTSHSFTSPSVERMRQKSQGLLENVRQKMVDMSRHSSFSSSSKVEGDLRVNNLEYHVTENDLQEHCNQYAQVESVRVPFDTERGHNRGYGYVKLSDPAGADEAVRLLNDSQLNDRTLIVHPMSMHSSQSTNGGGTVRLYVGNLDVRTRKDRIREVFSQTCRVVSVILPMANKETGQNKGYCFVVVKDQAKADLVIDRWNGFLLDGSYIKVEPAHDKQPRKGPRHGPRRKRPPAPNRR